MTEQPSAVTIARRVLSSLQVQRLKIVGEQEAPANRLADIDQTIAKARAVVSQFDCTSPGRTAA